MYGGQPPPHPHHLQHAQHQFDPAGGLSVDPNAPAAMDPNDFNAFSYSFQGMDDPSAMMGMPGQAGVASTGSFTGDGISPHITSVQVPPDSIAAMSVSRASFDAGQGARKSSLSTPTAQHERRTSQLGGALDDDETNTDEFGLASSSRNPADGTDLGGRTKDANKTGNDAPPSWSELKTKAGKDRKRLPLACIACRRKKIRCSGEKPACKHCLRARIPCVYKVTTRKAAPRTDYMAMLDKRLKRMEERIIKVIPKSDQGKTSDITRAVVKPQIPGVSTGNRAGSKKRAADEAFGASLEAWSKASPKADGVSTPCSQDDEENKLFEEGSDALPPSDLQEHLSEVYFENVYGQAYPLLHKPSYMRKLKNGTLPPVLVLSVCAVAARFSSSPRLNSPSKQFLRGEEWAAPARDICTRRYESPNITILTCLLILGLHEFGTCQGGRSWALGGQAIRMAFALQLHKDLEYDPTSRHGKGKLSFVDREIRRRIMWSCFIMDRFNSSGTERPMFIKEEIVNIPLPVKERHFLLDMPAVTETLDGKILSSTPSGEDAAGDAAENLGVAAFVIRAIALWGRIIAYINQGGQEIDPQPMWNTSSGFAQLAKEAESLPHALTEPLLYSADNLALHQNHHTTNQFLLLHIILQQNILFLNRAAMVPQQGKPTTFIDAARPRAFAAADQTSQLLKDAEEALVTVSAPFASYCAFSSTAMHIRGIVSGDAATKARSEANATTNIRYLRKMMKFWGMFHWMEDDIRSQYRVALDRSKSGKPVDDSMIGSSILQYGDWFTKYPHGVADAEYMDPSSQKRKEKGADGVLEQKPELQSVEEFFTTLASPQAATDQQNQAKPAPPKRKAAKKSGGTPTKTASQPPPKSIDITAAASSVQDQQMTPHTQAPPQRRPSAPIAHTSGPASFHPLVTTHPQATAFHAMSPISPMDQFQNPQQNQAGFYSPHMMQMNMQQQQAANPMMQQTNPQMVFNGYPMDPSNVPNGQHMINGVQGWSGPRGQHVANQHGSSAMMGQPTQGHNRPAPNGMSQEGWFMPFDMQGTDGAPGMMMAQGHPDGFNGMFTSGDMSVQNPPGGLHHAQ